MNKCMIFFTLTVWEQQNSQQMCMKNRYEFPSDKREAIKCPTQPVTTIWGGGEH